MGTSRPGKPSSNREMVIKELVQGQEFATQLKTSLEKPLQEHGCLPADELVVKILRSFTQTLSVLSSCESSEASQNLATSYIDDSRCVDDRRSEDSSESRKKPASKDRRGCYKRKRNSEMQTVVSPTMEDGHAWRKYGQKEILNAKYSRSYFRCTRKFEQGCKATKQVQRMEDDPQMYQTTYIGVHTCRDILKSPQIITDSNPWESFIVCSSDTKIPSEQDDHHHHFIPEVKQESKVGTPSDITHNISSLDSIIWKDLMSFESSEPAIMSPKMGSDYGDVVSNVYSCNETTSHSFEMGFKVKSVDFDTDFQFDEIQF